MYRLRGPGLGTNRKEVTDADLDRALDTNGLSASGLPVWRRTTGHSEVYAEEPKPEELSLIRKNNVDPMIYLETNRIQGKS